MPRSTKNQGAAADGRTVHNVFRFPERRTEQEQLWDLVSTADAVIRRTHRLFHIYLIASFPLTALGAWTLGRMLGGLVV